MEFLIQDIIDSNQNFKFDFELDLKTLVKNTNKDVLDLSLVHVYGNAYVVDNSEFVFDINVSCNLVMQCSVTLEDVPYLLEYKGTETFGYKKIDEDTNLITGDRIDLTEIIEDYVILNIPIRVVKKGYENKDNSQIVDVYDDSPFASLKDLIK